MSISLLNSCIQELEIPSRMPRKIDIISGYLYSLKNFMLLIRGKKEKVKNALDKLSTLIKLKKTKKHEIIISEGDKGKQFYILLKGKIAVLTPKTNEYYMSKEEYISYLFQLKLNDQNELIHKTLSLNSNIYSIHEDSFDSFIYNLSIGKSLDESYSKYINLIKKAKQVYQYISEQKKILELSNAQEYKKEVIISPENYIIQNSVPEDVVKNTALIENYIKKLEAGGSKTNEEDMNESSDDDNENVKKLLSNRNKIFIPSHEIFGELESGNYFGELALEEKTGKRHATLISTEECCLGAIEKNDYFFLLHHYIEKAHNKYLSFITTFYIFKNLSTAVWEKRYITFFINRVYEKDYLLLKEGENIDQVYFTYKGEFELSTNKNLLELNELIIYYKKILRELLNIDKNNNNKEIIRYCDFREEVKENDNFILNKKFEGEKMKKLVNDKRTIKIGILSSKEIIGLLDIYSSIKYKKTVLNGEKDNFKIKAYQMKSLYNCKCISCNCEVYSFPLIKFKYMLNHEDKVEELTNEVEIKKIYFMIERLKHYKNFLFESMYFKENQNKKDIKKIENKSIPRGIKNKFEPNIAYSNVKLKDKVLNLSIPKFKTFKNYAFQRKLSNSYSNYKFPNNSYDKKKIFIKHNNEMSSTNYKIINNNGRFKIKQKFFQSPTIDDSLKNNEAINIKKNSFEKPLKLNTEIKKNNDKTTPTMNPIMTEGNLNLSNKTRNFIIENYGSNKNSLQYNNDNNKIKNFSSKSNKSKKSFINVDKLGDNYFNKKALIKQNNWVSQVLIKNLVYNHIFDKVAFSSNKNSRNNFNFTQNNPKNNLKISDEKIILKTNDHQSKYRPLLIKNDESSISKNEINKTESKLFLKKINKSLSIFPKMNKIKNVKRNLNSENKKKKDNNITNENRNPIYDVLIYENFNKYFNERVYKKFFEDS